MLVTTGIEDHYFHKISPALVQHYRIQRMSLPGALGDSPTVNYDVTVAQLGADSPDIDVYFGETVVENPHSQTVSLTS